MALKKAAAKKTAAKKATPKKKASKKTAGKVGAESKKSIPKEMAPPVEIKEIPVGVDCMCKQKGPMANSFASSSYREGGYNLQLFLFLHKSYVKKLIAADGREVIVTLQIPFPDNIKMMPVMAINMINQ